LLIFSFFLRISPSFQFSIDFQAVKMQQKVAILILIAALSLDLANSTDHLENVENGKIKNPVRNLFLPALARRATRVYVLLCSCSCSCIACSLNRQKSPRR
jgi:hypothetical protein